MHQKHFAPTSIRNFIFGVEDSLVSTVGLLSGIAVAGVPQSTIVLTGLILIAVEGLSMAVGSFLSEDAAEEAQQHTTSDVIARQGAFVMFFSYIIAGFVPLLPYFFSASGLTLWYSIGLTFIGLVVLGITSSKLFNVPLFKSTSRILVLGGGAIVVGVLVGRLMPS